MLADALREARIERRELEVGPVLLDQPREFRHAEEAAGFRDDRVAASRPSLTTAGPGFGHLRLELEPDDPAAAAALDRGAEIADQILGFFLDLDVAVADDPERAAAQHVIFAGTDNRSCAGSAFRARCSALLAGNADEAGQARRRISSSRTAGLALLHLEDQAKPGLGMNGKGCAGSIACGVRNGKICSRKWLSSHVSALSSSGSSATTSCPPCRARPAARPRLRAGW